ncbi:MAG: hypothetical protein ACJAXK_001893 [Yoonia sp.]|jgi:hypothetical protein
MVRPTAVIDRPIIRPKVDAFTLGADQATGKKTSSGIKLSLISETLKVPLGAFFLWGRSGRA